MLFEDLIKHIPYDMTEVRARAEGVFSVLESRVKLNKKVITFSIEGATPKHNNGAIL